MPINALWYSVPEVPVQIFQDIFSGVRTDPETETQQAMLSIPDLRNRKIRPKYLHKDFQDGVPVVTHKEKCFL